MKKFSNTLKKMDLFGEQITLTFYGKKKFQTTVGATLTLIMFISLFLISYSKLDSVLERTYTIIQSRDAINLSAPEIDLKYKFAIQITPSVFTSSESKRYFDYFASYSTYITLKNGTVLKAKSPFDLIPCKQAHFPQFSQSYLQKIGINQWLCPDYDSHKDLGFVVKGKYNDEIYNFIQLSILKCTEKKNNNYNDTCATDDEIEEVKKMENKIYFNLIFINNLINLNDYENTLTPYIDRTSFLFDNKNFYLQKEHLFTSVSIVTDITQSLNILRRDENKLKIKSHIFDGKFEEYKLNNATILNGNEAYVSVYLRSGSLNKNFERKYETFQDFLQTLGSLYSLAFLLFKILSNYFTHSKRIKKMAKSFYEFEEKNVRRKKKPQNKELEPSKNKDSRNRTSCFRKFWLFFQKCRQRNNVGEYNLSFIEKQLNKDLDVVHLFMEIKRLENLKNILINDDQKLVLDSTGKQIFQRAYLRDRNKSTKFSLHLSKIINLFHNKSFKFYDHSEKLKNAYDNLLKDNNEISKKLCRIAKINFSSEKKLSLDMPNGQYKRKEKERSSTMNLRIAFKNPKKFNKINSLKIQEYLKN